MNTMRTPIVIAAVLFSASVANADNFSSFYGTWVAPGGSCDEYDPPESIMVVAEDHLDFLEVGCSYREPPIAVPEAVAKGSYFAPLVCSGIDSGPWEANLFLQQEPGNKLLQAFSGDGDLASHLKRCPQ